MLEHLFHIGESVHATSGLDPLSVAVGFSSHFLFDGVLVLGGFILGRKLHRHSHGHCDCKCHEHTSHPEKS